MKVSWRIVGLIAFVAACHNGAEASSLGQINVPAPAATTAAPPAIADSTVHVAIASDLAPLQEALFAALPRPLLKHAWQQQVIGKWGFKVDATLESELTPVDLRLAMSGTTLSVALTAELVASAKAGPLGVSCGVNETKPRITLTVNGNVSITPTADVTFAPIGDPHLTWIRPCNLSILRIPAEDVLKLPVVRDLLRSKLQALLADHTTYSFADKLARLWTELLEPKQIMSDAWLVIDPHAIYLGNFHGTATTAGLDIELAFQPALVVGVQPAATTTPLPPLSPIHAPDGFAVHLATRLSYDAAARLVAGNMLGRSTLGNLTFDVRKIRLYGTDNGHLIVAATIEQPFEGTVYLAGNPVFDEPSDTIQIPNLDCTTETHSVLAGLVGTAFHALFRDTLARAAHFSLDTKRQQALDWLQQRAITQGPLTVTATASDVHVDGITVGAQGISATVAARGTLTAQTRW